MATPWHDLTADQQTLLARICNISAPTLQRVVQERHPVSLAVTVDGLAKRLLAGATEQELIEIHNTVATRLRRRTIVRGKRP